MKWLLNRQNKKIGRKEKHNKVLMSLTPLLVILVGNKDMLPLIAHGRRKSKKC
jgi:hypothetical protein